MRLRDISQTKTKIIKIKIKNWGGEASKKIAWGGDKYTHTQTDRQTDIATTRKNRPKGRFFENSKNKEEEKRQKHTFSLLFKEISLSPKVSSQPWGGSHKRDIHSSRRTVLPLSNIWLEKNLKKICLLIVSERKKIYHLIILLFKKKNSLWPDVSSPPQIRIQVLGTWRTHERTKEEDGRKVLCLILDNLT